jgi:hypothetical protein
MTGEQQENDLDGFQRSVRGEWQQAGHEGMFHRELQAAMRERFMRKTTGVTSKNQAL